MLYSLSLILIIGFALSGIFNRIKIPGLIGMILTGILLGPYTFNLISPDILNISTELREIALIVILLRVGLSLDIKDLIKVGRPAILMCFLPATFEIIAVIIIAPAFFGFSYSEAAILGTVLAAVSPAVIVPRMLHLIESGYGKNKKIPQMLMAGASVDDIYVIVLFTAVMRMHQNDTFSVVSFISVPVSLFVGALVGIAMGLFLTYIFKLFHARDTIKVLIILSVSFIFITLEGFVAPYVPMSGLLSVMALGGTILKKNETVAKRLVGKFSKIWVGAEMLLFVLVGAAVDLNLLLQAGLLSVILIFAALLFRMIAVFLSLMKTELTNKEKLFCSISYIPKGTVQAAIGAIPLSAGIACGDTILIIAVLAIILTAPLGALLIDSSYKPLLQLDKNK